MAGHAHNPSTSEAEVGRLRARATLDYVETLSQSKQIHAVCFFSQTSSPLKNSRIWEDEENGINNSPDFIQLFAGIHT